MKLLPAALLLAAAMGPCSAFAPLTPSLTSPVSRRLPSSSSSSSMSLGVDVHSLMDPSSIHSAAQHAHSLSSLLLSDLDAAGVPTAAENFPRAMGSSPDPAAVSAAMRAVTTGSEDPQAAAAVADAASSNGWFGFLTGPIELLLQSIHSGLMMVGINGNGWGASIIGMTLLIKLLTFPLTKQQLESTNKMQALQPTIKSIQAKYESNPEVMNQKVAEVYKDNEVNPLAGCIPSIVQIPVFIGLYRAVLNLAKENKLDEPFLFLPNLEGPTYGADPAHGSDWIRQGWVDGVPSLGWHDTIAFLSIPIFLVISQFVSMSLMAPKSDDPQQQQANVILKFLPFMIGWFALNVPAALGVYWVVNNVATTASTLYVRSIMPAPAAAVGGGGSVAAPPLAVDASVTEFNPTSMNDRAVGFGGAEDESSLAEAGMKPITPMDAEIISDGETGGGVGEGAPKKRGGGKKKKKKRRN